MSKKISIVRVDDMGRRSGVARRGGGGGPRHESGGERDERVFGAEGLQRGPEPRRGELRQQGGRQKTDSRRHPRNAPHAGPPYDLSESRILQGDAGGNHRPLRRPGGGDFDPRRRADRGDAHRGYPGAQGRRAGGRSNRLHRERPDEGHAASGGRQEASGQARYEGEDHREAQRCERTARLHHHAPDHPHQERAKPDAGGRYRLYTGPQLPERHGSGSQGCAFLAYG